MFGVGLRVNDDSEACTGCSFVADHFDAVLPHLNGHDVTLISSSIAPLDKLLAYKRRMGWRFPWVSAVDSNFHHDFGVAFSDEEQRNGAEYNYAFVQDLPSQREGMSAFALHDGCVYHTYSTYGRGVESLISGLVAPPRRVRPLLAAPGRHPESDHRSCRGKPVVCRRRPRAAPMSPLRSPAGRPRTKEAIVPSDRLASRSPRTGAALCGGRRC